MPNFKKVEIWIEADGHISEISCKRGLTVVDMGKIIKVMKGLKKAGQELKKARRADIKHIRGVSS